MTRSDVILEAARAEFGNDHYKDLTINRFKDIILRMHRVLDKFEEKCLENDPLSPIFKFMREILEK